MSDGHPAENDTPGWDRQGDPLADLEAAKALVEAHAHPAENDARLTDSERETLAAGWPDFWKVHAAVEQILADRARVIPPVAGYPDMPCEDCEQGLSTCCVPPGGSR